MSLSLSVEKRPTQAFSRALVRIKFIQHIQIDIETAQVRNLNLKTTYLNQAYVIQLVAYWQIFIEDLAELCFSKLAQSESERPLFVVAKARFSEAINRFNTPSKSNIDKLFKEGLGLDHVTSCWHATSTGEDPTSTLSRVLETRHQIAHTGRTSVELSYAGNFTDMEVLMRAAQSLEASVVSRLTLA